MSTLRPTHLFRVRVFGHQWQRDQDEPSSEQWIVGAGRSRSDAAQRVMRHAYVGRARLDIHSVELVYHGTIAVAQ